MIVIYMDRILPITIALLGNGNGILDICTWMQETVGPRNECGGLEPIEVKIYF